MEAHVSASKKRTVEEFAQLMDTYPIVGIVNMENLPARQVQTMRAALRKQGIVLRMTKGRLIAKAIELSKKKDIKQLTSHLKGMPAIIFTRENPFALFKLLKKSQSKAPIKAGQKAPHDIVVPAGPTGFAPGPIISELGSVGIKAGIDAGKVAIKVDSTVAREGQVVDQKLAGLLARLGIEPMRIGLDLTAVFENGEILTRTVLDIDEDAFKLQLATAHNEAFALAMEIAWPSADTTTRLVQHAFMDAVGLALERGVVNGETLKPMLGKAYAMSLAVAGKLPDEALSAEAQALLEGAAEAAPAAASHAPKAEKKDEKKAEEATAAGLGSLFG